MSWMAKLYDTYEAALTLDLDGDVPLLPVAHVNQQAHIRIVIDGEGNFLRAEVLDKLTIMLPATEASAGRTSGEAPHPLADKLQYVAKDYSQYGGKKKSYFSSYEAQLKHWCESDHAHPKAQAVYRYITKGKVMADLIDAGVVHIDEQGKLLTAWPKEKGDPPRIFKVLPRTKGEIDYGSALVAWSVEIAGDVYADTWTDESLQRRWIEYLASQAGDEGLCFVTGRLQPIATNHPKRIRYPGDSAKLISANDKSGFTFRGRFASSGQAAEIGFETTQKAHNALRWLIERQGFRVGDQVFVSWAVSGKPIPQPSADSWALLYEEICLDDTLPLDQETALIDHNRDLGESFAYRFNRYMAGYRAELNPTEEIVVLGLDSASPGRMSIIYYRTLMASEFLERLTRWHREFAWYQRHTREVVSAQGKKRGKEVIWAIGAPAPVRIVEAAYGSEAADNLKKKTIERLMSCIIDATPFPRDLLDCVLRRVVNRLAYKAEEFWRWEQDLGVACALYRGYFQRHPKSVLRKEYSMTLDLHNRSRDYLYGRLLAIAERIEEVALRIADENRTTTAARLMQRFADRPFSTWRTLELALQPYMQRLQTNRAGFLTNRKKELDSVLAAFEREDFIKDTPLSGEFLLAYHCQRQAWKGEKDEMIESGVKEGNG